MLTVGDVVQRLTAPGKRHIETIARLPQFLGNEVGHADDAVRAMLPDLGAPGGVFSAPIESASVGARRIEHPYPVILIHGYSGSPEYMEPMRRSLVRDNYSAYSYRAPREGIGDARIAGKEVAQMALDVSKQHGGAPVILAGHSRGGMIAVDAAVHHLKPGRVAAIEGMLSPLEGKHTLPGVPGGEVIDAVARRFARNPITDLFVPEGSLEQLLAGSKYVQSLKDRDLAADGVQLISVFRDKSDGLVAPLDAHMTMPGWENVPMHVPSRVGEFQHLRMVTHNNDFYERVVSDFNRVSTSGF